MVLDAYLSRAQGDWEGETSWFSEMLLLVERKDLFDGEVWGEVFLLGEVLKYSICQINLICLFGFFYFQRLYS